MPPPPLLLSPASTQTPILPQTEPSDPSVTSAILATARPELDLLELRQAASNYYITLSITKDYTTYTTTILLGGYETNVPVNPAPTTVVAVNATPTPTPTPNPPQQTGVPITAAPTSTDPSAGTIIGAIFGSIFGSFLLIFLWWLFCVRGRLFGIESDSGSSDGSRRSSSSGSIISNVRVRI